MIMESHTSTHGGSLLITDGHEHANEMQGFGHGYGEGANGRGLGEGRSVGLIDDSNGTYPWCYAASTRLGTGKGMNNSRSEFAQVLL